MAARKASAIPGGGTGKNSAYLFRTLDGYRAVHKDGAGGAMTRKANARTFGQHLMRGEHELGASAKGTKGSGANRLTWVADGRGDGDLDDTSRKILASGRKATRPEGFEGAAPESEIASGTSIFDPVLCELAYRWFCPPGGLILDPFSGGSVRGIVSSKLGRRYVGVDLRPEQVAANREQGERLCGEPMPIWHAGDSRRIDEIVVGCEADFVFSCPPYADLERYSDDPSDLSTLEYSEFRRDYAEIVQRTMSLLKPDRFACFIVGDVRDKKGFYHNFPGHTIEAFEAAGARLYNEAILVTAVGSLSIRVGKQFAATRKLGKTHQNVYVFCKGNPRKATEAIGDVEFGEVPDTLEHDAAGEEAAYGEKL